MTTRLRPWNGFRDVTRCSSRIWETCIPFRLSSSSASSTVTVWTSAWMPAAMRRQGSQPSHGGSSPSQLRAWASFRASVCFPTRSGPTNR